ncbi:hypothetical protein HZ326_27251 [Fusarium oxysporum f. sp. albedinis]|nr:hypothetical protein HZ326_27251 [Fusarium oxysporum f. sp. albedinis]
MTLENKGMGDSPIGATNESKLSILIMRPSTAGAIGLASPDERKYIGLRENNVLTTTTRTSALIPELCCVTLGSYQPRLRLSAGQGGVIRHVGLRDAASSITNRVQLGTC